MTISLTTGQPIRESLHRCVVTLVQHVGIRLWPADDSIFKFMETMKIAFCVSIHRIAVPF